MSGDSVDLVNDLQAGIGNLQSESPELVAAFVQMDQAAYVEGELERKYKELIGIGIAVAVRCEYCINIHVKNALSEGASREEILEAAAVAVAFGGSPAMAYVATTVLKALEAFE
ncbi:carboxymuconolactone decarboxylase family protein [Sporomusa sp. KB1]|uniref:carboxymuconolactone decarboxylase family protein n=1 Tax=Sporomusa sp. KB1 TaxID=943346 RepID=UPI0011A51C3F|nr:carboxymuconolactone decarboxylase family protein [Sporomusa sp. KB1]TWH49345.1 pyruvate dehydrogenase E2 component (dihydrolipoamide acetyltransferase) [Sporomusa sp. KB1]